MLTAPHSTCTGHVACNAMEICVQVNSKVQLLRDVYGFIRFNCFHDLSVRHQEINLGNSEDNLHKAGSNVAKTSWLKWESAAVTLHLIPTHTHTHKHMHTHKTGSDYYSYYLWTQMKSQKGHGNAHRCWLAGDYIDDVIKIHFVS